MIFYMLRFLQRILLALALAGAVHSASAFSLLGPYAVTDGGTVWQVPDIGYNLPGDIGGPMNLGEEYRWNIQTITYGFDESFLNYFGAQGTNAITQAMNVLNALPAFSQMSSNLSEFPLQTMRENSRAGALQLLDVKSVAMSVLLEEMGLAMPERFVWTLRSRVIGPGGSPTNYTVIMRNFDPVTWAPSKYVNGALYTYTISEDTVPQAVTVISSVDPLAFTYTTVAYGNLSYGNFYIGLTRDDVGGLRYSYRASNRNIESVIPGTTGGGGGPWSPVGGAATNFVNIALRPGVDKITFVPTKYDSVLGNFITVTNTYKDTYITNSQAKTQNLQRVLTQPDILFAAADLGVGPDGSPGLVGRNPGWVDNDTLNGQVTLSGPGQISPQIIIYFSNVGPWYYNTWPFFLDEASGGVNGHPIMAWGSFDGTTNEPVVYPIGTSIQDLEQWVLGGQ